VFDSRCDPSSCLKFIVFFSLEFLSFHSSEKAFDHRRDIINHNRPVVLPTAPKSARAPDIDLSKIPNHPPFKAYLGNLPYETTEEEIERFFKNKKVRIFSW